MHGVKRMYAYERGVGKVVVLLTGVVEFGCGWWRGELCLLPRFVVGELVAVFGGARCTCVHLQGRFTMYYASPYD
jgi:hypothetical protein